MKRIVAVAALLVVGGAYAAVAGPAQSELEARAAVAADDARATALGLVPGGVVLEAELEEENGRLQYAYDVRAPDGTVHDIEIDALSGAVLQDEIEIEDDGAGDDTDDDDPGPTGR